MSQDWSLYCSTLNQTPQKEAAVDYLDDIEVEDSSFSGRYAHEGGVIEVDICRVSCEPDSWILEVCLPEGHCSGIAPSPPTGRHTVLSNWPCIMAG
jgi:hypothetical protein